jgi:protein required for attachment to host cells
MSRGNGRAFARVRFETDSKEESMALPHRALVLVADGTKVLFLRNQGDQNQIDLRTEAHDERPDAKDRELRTDSQGAKPSSWGGTTDTTGETDFHEQEEVRWVKEAAEELKKRALRNDFEALAIIAPPKALGTLRKELHKEVERRIVLTINKEMTDRPIPDIEELLVGEAAPPA